jgi:hypothetical protein
VSREAGFEKEDIMGLFGNNKKKEQKSAITEYKCNVDGCDFTCDDSVSLAKHTDWKHPQKAQGKDKEKAK